MLRVLIRERIEGHRYRRKITGVDIDKVDLAGRSIKRGAVRNPDAFDERAPGGDDEGRPGDVLLEIEWPAGTRRGRTLRLADVDDERDRGRSVRQHDRRQRHRNQRIGEMIE